MALRICGVGDNVVDRYVELGVMFPGGNALNVAIFAARAGAGAGYLGITGSDAAGDLVRRALAEEGVDTSRAKISPAFNAFSQIGLDETGNRYFIGSTPPPYRLDLDEDDLAYLSGFDVVHTGDYGQIEDRLEEVAKRAPISFDFGSRPFSYAEPLLRFVRFASFSGSDLSTDEVVDRIRRVRAQGPEVVVVTRGAEGSMVGRAGEIHHQPAVPVTVRDSLGAGDSFIAAMLVGLFDGASLPEAAYRAALAAAEVCTHHGAFGYGMHFTSGAAGK